MKELIRLLTRIILKVFYVFPVNHKKIYLVNFNGTSYGFEAKAFAEYVLNNNKEKYELFWEITDFSNFREVKGINFVKKNSICAIFHSLTSGLLLFNTTPRSYLPYRKSQYIVETWHGYPFKKVGRYAIRYNRYVYSIPTVYSSHSDFYENKVVKDSFEYTGRILNCGSPRNDVFFSANKDIKKEEILSKLGFQNKKIAIYAPTFRGDFQLNNQELDFEKIRRILEKKFGGDWIVLFRYHPMVMSKLKDSYSVDTRYDVSLYPDMQDLLLISDVLISDYSGSIWDFSLQRKPVFLFVPDLEEYNNDRGLYYPHHKLPYPLAKTEEELEDAIICFHEKKYKENLELYFKEMGCHEAGHSCESIMLDYKSFCMQHSNKWKRLNK